MGSQNTARFVAPNYKPQACALRVQDNHEFPTRWEYNDDSVFNQQCIVGVHGCVQEDVGSPFTEFGNVNNEECTNEGHENFDESSVLSKQIFVGLDGVNMNETMSIMIEIGLMVIGLFALYMCLGHKHDKMRKEIENANRYTPVASVPAWDDE